MSACEQQTSELIFLAYGQPVWKPRPQRHAWAGDLSFFAEILKILAIYFQYPNLCILLRLPKIFKLLCLYIELVCFFYVFVCVRLCVECICMCVCNCVCQYVCICPPILLNNRLWHICIHVIQLFGNISCTPYFIVKQDSKRKGIAYNSNYYILSLS